MAGSTTLSDVLCMPLHARSALIVLDGCRIGSVRSGESIDRVIGAPPGARLEGTSQYRNEADRSQKPQCGPLQVSELGIAGAQAG